MRSGLRACIGYFFIIFFYLFFFFGAGGGGYSLNCLFVTFLKFVTKNTIPSCYVCDHAYEHVILLFILSVFTIAFWNIKT